MSGITQVKLRTTILDLVQGDITTQNVDVIVNAANSTLSGGGGVDGAIHRAAGKGLLKECLTLGRCPTGEARLTGGYDLPAKHVIHAVGPVYQQYDDPAPLLADCHINSLIIAKQHNLKTIAFPAISTGVYGYPLEEAAQVALHAVVDTIKKHRPDFELVRFVLFDAKAFSVFQRTLQQLIDTDDALVLA